MPTNLPHESLELERKHREAKTLPEKIRTLEEYINSIPQHKGTAKLRAHLRTRLSKLRDDMDHQKKRGSASARQRSPFDIKKEGAAQVVLVGLTQTGKSSLLQALTNAKVAVDSRSYTTQAPALGMMDIEDIQIQLVDAPALPIEAAEAKAWKPAVLGLCRNADGILLVLDARKDPAQQLQMLTGELRNVGIYSKTDELAGVDLTKTSAGGIQIVAAGSLNVDAESLRRIVIEAGVRNAVVKISGPIEEDRLRQAVTGGIYHKPFVVALNKIDAADPRIMDEFAIGLSATLDIIPVSVFTGEGLDALRRRMYSSLGIMRIYTRRPGQKELDKPFILPQSSTVQQLAKGIHTDLPERFRFAKVWGPSANYPGERIGLNRQLRDGDIVEIYAS
ncbi:MAG: GTPase [Candidatus Bathyarchaeia archaeon]